MVILPCIIKLTKKIYDFKPTKVLQISKTSHVYPRMAMTK